MSRTDLVKRAKNGDSKAFAQLYVIHKDSLYRYAYFKLGNQTDAQDAVSECVVEAYAGIGLLKNEKAFSSWLFKILYRQCCAIIKRNTVRREEVSLDDCAGLSKEDNLLAPELHEALAQLSDEDRDIVLLSVVAGYKTREIAGILSLNHSTVRSRLSRALAKMKNFLE
jgi:RNA polymerase sigma-70 factor (ECF subfamily)